MVGTAICAECTGPTQGSSLVTQQIDGNGKVTYFTYDALDRLVKQIRKQNDTAFVADADDAVTTYTYDPNNNRLTLTEPDGNTTSYEYDKLDRQTKMTNAAHDVTLTHYDPDGNIDRITAPNLNVTMNTYDSLDRLIQVDDSVGRVASYTYDPVGNRLTECDGNNHCTTNTYDTIYRLTAVTDALGKTTHYDYDFVGNLTKTTDRENHVTTYAYDKINRRIQMTDALGNVTDYQYDGVGNLKRIQITDAVDHKVEPTDYAYDGINRLIKETYPDDKSRFFGYDAVNLISRKDQKNQVTNYLYSDLYFLRERDYPGTDHDDTMTYDLSGRMLSACRGGAPDNLPADSCAGWLVTFAYDGANRVTQTKQNGKTVSYVYDIPGRQRTLTYPGGRVITENTDPRSRLATIDDTVSPPPIVTYSYDLGNRVVTRNYRNGTAASYSYNDNNWITDLEHKKSATLIAGFAHDYDNEGNKLFENKLHDTAHSEAYQPYDPLYRLIHFKVGTLDSAGTVPVPLTQTQYKLDGLGNWDQKIKDGTTENRSYLPPPHNLVNELTAIDVVSPPSHEDLSYDDNGNLIEDGRYRYAYDEENRLTQVTRKSDSAVVGKYQYDALSRRIQKIANPAGSSTTMRYFYDDARIIEEQDAGGTTLATYVYGNYIDEVLTMTRGSGTFYYHQNSLWSVEAITDASATVVERYSYDAYGLPSVFTGSGTPVSPNTWGTPHSAIGNPWMFTGRQFDEETGIYFYQTRYYDPVKGKLLQRDPLEYVAGMNLYEYVKGNPINLVDPFGLDWTWGHIWRGAVAGAVVAAGVAAIVVTAPVSVPALLVGAAVVGAGAGAVAAGSLAKNDNEAWAYGAYAGVMVGSIAAAPVGAVRLAGIGSRTGALVGLGGTTAATQAPRLQQTSQTISAQNTGGIIPPEGRVRVSKDILERVINMISTGPKPCTVPPGLTPQQVAQAAGNPNATACFCGGNQNTSQMLLAQRPNYPYLYDLWHELGHYLHWARGWTGYSSGQAEREFQAFRNVITSEYWRTTFTQGERTHAITYVTGFINEFKNIDPERARELQRQISELISIYGR